MSTIEIKDRTPVAEVQLPAPALLSVVPGLAAWLSPAL